MEQTSQVGPLTGGDEALREELGKWRERVPKLAAALRQRADEVQRLQRELDRLRSLQGAADTHAGIRARDELIGELERELAAVSSRHREARGELHRQQLEIEALRGDVTGWKQKWQATTRALDEGETRAAAREDRLRVLEEDGDRLRRQLEELTAAQQADQRGLDEVVQERDSLRHRNEQLFETTEMANRQIGSLTESLAELRVSVKQHREREAETDAVHARLTGEIEALQSRLAQAEETARHQASRLATAAAETDGSRERVGELERVGQEAARQLAEVEEARVSLASSLEQQTAEVGRLTDVVERAQRTIDEREDERRELSERLQDLEDRNDHLEKQLAERSELVMALEQDQAGQSESRESLERERDELKEALLRAERNVKENADYVAQLDDKLERQKELMLNLEQELAEAKDERAGLEKSSKAEKADADAELTRLKDQVLKLEGVLRDRTDDLNRMQWQHDDSSEAPRPPGDEGHVRPSAGVGDDLTRIHGVGEKLAEQLNDLGIHHYHQIAELDEDALADEGHVLHPHRSRIVRDGWIEQAARLISH